MKIGVHLPKLLQKLSRVPVFIGPPCKFRLLVGPRLDFFGSHGAMCQEGSAVCTMSMRVRRAKETLARCSLSKLTKEIIVKLTDVTLI